MEKPKPSLRERNLKAQDGLDKFLNAYDYAADYMSIARRTVARSIVETSRAVVRPVTLFSRRTINQQIEKIKESRLPLEEAPTDMLRDERSAQLRRLGRDRANPRVTARLDLLRDELIRRGGLYQSVDGHERS